MANWNIDLSSLGIGNDYGQKIKEALDGAINQQYNDAINFSKESSLASGNFNPALSNYYATKGARESQVSGNVKSVQAGREDEFKRFAMREAMNNFDLQQGYLDLQRDQWESTKPGVWDDIFGVVNTIGKGIAFLADGGEVASKAIDGNSKKNILTHYNNLLENLTLPNTPEIRQMIISSILDIEMKYPSIVNGPLKAVSAYASGGGIKSSEHFVDNYDGYIPSSEINSDPAHTGDNVLIMAKNGERIIRPEGDKMTMGATQLINDSVELIKSLIH